MARAEHLRSRTHNLEDCCAYRYSSDAVIAALGVTGTEIGAALETLQRASADPPEPAPAAWRRRPTAGPATDRAA